MYSPIAQINESLDYDESGNLQRRNVLINIREDSVEAAYQQYTELRDKILGGNGNSNVSGGENISVQEAEIPSNAMRCDCGKEMILREGRNGFFFGCEGYPECRITKSATASVSDATSNKTKKQNTQENASPVTVCPRHKVKMLIRTRKSDGELFLGCALFNQKGCLEILPYPAQKKANVKVPAVTY